jgi:alkylation response protein AidB-like acyl-CoA dehydrogenase
MGLRTSPMGEVIFEDCVVPEARGSGPRRGHAHLQLGDGMGARLHLRRHLGAMERCSTTASRTRSSAGSSGSRSPSSQSIADRIAT